MLFSEIYGNYFNTVAEILSEATKGELSNEKIREIVQAKAFGESSLTIPAALADGRWPVIDSTGNTPLQNEPSMPLTLIQKRWLKSLLLDSRIQLFCPDITGLKDIEPLFTAEDVVYFDQYADGDPFEEQTYREHFHVILTAIKNRQKVAIKIINRRGAEVTIVCAPHRLEYSAKDNKFRLLGATKNHTLTVNLAKIITCRYAGHYDEREYPIRESIKEELILELTDERNALERCMLHFSDFEKVTEKIDELHYRFLIRYDRDDETEVLIRVLSFGPKLEVIAPKDFRDKIKERLLRQKSCGR